MYTGKMQSKVLQAIETTPIITIPFSGTSVNVKDLRPLHLVVEVTINQFDAGFLNGDICTVLYECVDEKGSVIIERLDDKSQGKIRKDVLRIPVEFMNFEQYLLGDGMIKEGGF